MGSRGHINVDVVDELSRRAPCGVWQVTADGRRTLFVNPAMCRFLEVDDADAIDAATLDRFFPAALRKSLTEERAVSVAPGFDVDCDGSRTLRAMIAPIADSDGVESLLGVFVDVTARDRGLHSEVPADVERDLRQSLARFEALFESPLQATLLVDPSGRIEALNGLSQRWLSELTGGSVEPGASLLDLPLGYQEGELRSKLERALLGETVFVDRTVVTSHGDTRGFDVRVGPMRLREGEIIGACITAVDVTERHREVAERERLQERLRESQALEAIGRLAGGVAHDFNNLLTAILCHAEMLIESGPAADPREAAVAIRSAGERAADLTRQLLAFGRQELLRVERIDLNDAVRSAERMLRRLLEANITIEVQLDPATPAVLADAAQLKQIIFNLAINARDAMPEGGVLRIETHARAITDSSELPAGDYASLVVKDTGEGMSDEVCRRVFEPFFTTKELGKGTGLGLATVYGLVAQHGGRISVESALGQGSRFSVLVPADVRRVRRRPSRRTTRATILLIEDELLVRSVSCNVLRGQDFEVIEAGNGAEALQRLEAVDGQVDLILSDVVMPKMAGPQLHDEVRRRYPNVKLIYMSGYAEDHLSERGFDVVGELFLHKPFSPTELVDVVGQALARK